MIGNSSDNSSVAERIGEDFQRREWVEGIGMCFSYQADSPKHLLYGRRQRFARILCLCGSEADQFGATEREGGGDKGRAQSLEPVVEGTRVVPVVGS